MTEKRFKNVGKDILQYGEWWCSANGEHCADVIATAMNELIKENEQLKEAVWSWSKSYTRVYEKNELLKQRIDYLIRELKMEMATSISRNKRIRLDFAIRVLESLKK